ncbi:hypothetical protein D3C76_1213630 [compost metagenome]
MLHGQNPPTGHPNKDICPSYNLRYSTLNSLRIGCGSKLLPFRIIILEIFSENAFTINRINITRTRCQQQITYGHPSRPNTHNNNPCIFNRFIYNFKRIQKSCKSHHGCSMLIIMKYRNVQLFRKPAFDFKAAWRTYIL